MSFRVRIDPVALREIESFAAYLGDYSEDFALEQFERLRRILSTTLREAPLMWGYFPLTGAPYRAYLFRVGRRTHTGSSIELMRTLEPSTFSRANCKTPQ